MEDKEINSVGKMERLVGIYDSLRERVRAKVEEYRIRKRETLEEKAYASAESSDHWTAGTLLKKAAKYAAKCNNERKRLELLQRAANSFEEDAESNTKRAMLLRQELLERIRNPQPYHFIGDWREGELKTAENIRGLLRASYYGFYNAATALKETNQGYFKERCKRLTKRSRTSLRMSLTH